MGQLSEHSTPPPSRQRKAKEPKKSRLPKGTIPFVPLLLELTLTIARLLVLLVGVIVAMVSLLAGVEVWLAVVRACVAMFVVGLLLWFANWFLARNTLDYAISERKKELEQEKEQDSVASTIERQA